MELTEAGFILATKRAKFIAWAEIRPHHESLLCRRLQQPQPRLRSHCCFGKRRQDLL
jgi:hypothetical protein